jgi:repressor LexA
MEIKPELTERQQAILDFISMSVRERGFPPSLREISSQFGIQSTQGVLRHLEALEKKGYIKRDSRAARSMQIMGERPSPEDDLNLRMVPIIGQVAAGSPIAAVENVEDQIPFSKDWLSMGKDYFLLRVKGDSMAEAIQPGDLVLVERQTRAELGQIVVAMIDEEATVKRFFQEKNRVLLRADNPSYSDIVVENGAELQILGKVTGLVRKY